MSFRTFVLSFLFPQTVEVVESPINGPIKALLFFGRYKLEAGGLTQSGEYVEDLLGKALKRAKRHLRGQVNNILILGLGGGSIVKRINKLWPQANIVGVEIDSVMVNLGKKYLHLSKVKNLEIVIDDAISYVRRNKEKFELIIVDLYLGYELPKAAESLTFVESLAKIVRKNGVVVFNRLYFGKYRKSVEKFMEMVTRTFPHVSSQKVYSNILIFARK